LEDLFVIVKVLINIDKGFILNFKTYNTTIHIKNLT